MYLWHKKCLLAFLTLSMLLAVCSCAGKQISSEGSTEDNQTGYDESYPEYDAPTEPSIYDEIGEDDLDSIMDARELHEQSYYGIYYNQSGIFEERQDYRLSCLQNGVNLATFGSNGYNMRGIYDNAVRNVYNMAGADVVVCGQVVYVERNGISTAMFIQVTDLNPFIVIAQATDDIPVAQNDRITVFGSMDGLEKYTYTNQNNVTTEHDTINISICDYYLGDTCSVYANPQRNLYTSFHLITF